MSDVKGPTIKLRVLLVANHEPLVKYMARQAAAAHSCVFNVRWFASEDSTTRLGHLPRFLRLEYSLIGSQTGS